MHGGARARARGGCSPAAPAPGTRTSGSGGISWGPKAGSLAQGQLRLCAGGGRGGAADGGGGRRGS